MINIDIVGNGASSRLWTRTDRPWIQCNIPHNQGTPDFAIIIDRQPITWMHENNYKLTCPIYGTKRANDLQKQYKLDLDFHQEWINPQDSGFMNSGQAAVIKFADECEQIHLWGFDSMYQSITNSLMDDKVKRVRNSSLKKQWDIWWNRIFIKYPKQQFFVYGKDSAKLQGDYGQNVHYRTVD